MSTAGTRATNPLTMSGYVWLQLLLLGAIWGGSFFFARIAVQFVPPFTLVLIRVAVAALALQVFLLARGIRFLDYRSHVLGFAGLGILNNAIPFSLLFIGQTALGAGLASIFNATTPIWTVLLATVLTADEKATPRKLTGIGLGIAGIIVMMGPSIGTSFGAPLWAQLAVIGATLSYALASILAKRFKAVPPTVTATGQLTASTLIMIPLVLMNDGVADFSGVSPGVWLAILALGLLSTAFAYILFFSIVRSGGATNASLVTLIVPVSAILLGTIFLGERLALQDFIGMGLIAIGLLVIDGRIEALMRRS
ncbi:DMT family transporter [Phyllobacterium sp. 21LDTY02-6]|uniref:DMT family transporter n=1 Tax=Phyllobacterium sp. 21LDTY02-6 TaxID=2944903 RepID=UPI00202245CA|nr:DMT family transporter [Phyllobacterium sp. 21LDTY02-6]MCO4315950.1 DMT family transporter [Phyllobacterium sp. 21LDTY02-6]